MAVGVWHMIASTPRFSVQACLSRRAWRRRRAGHRTRPRSRRRRSKNFICTRRAHGFLELQVPEPVGTRRSL
jgi:hypothetical protein